MRERFAALGRILLQGVIWVFVLSIRVDGQTLFHRAHEVLVNNQIVAANEAQATRGFRAAVDMATSSAGSLLKGRGQG